jgi:hypothetical protein
VGCLVGRGGCQLIEHSKSHACCTYKALFSAHGQSIHSNLRPTVGDFWKKAAKRQRMFEEAAKAPEAWLRKRSVSAAWCGVIMGDERLGRRMKKLNEAKHLSGCRSASTCDKTSSHIILRLGLSFDGQSTPPTPWLMETGQRKLGRLEHGQAAC